MTWAEIYEAVQKLINQTPANSQRFSTDEFVRAINDAYLSIIDVFVNKARSGALGFDVLEPLIKDVFQAGSALALPNDFWKEITVTINYPQGKRAAKIVPYDEFIQLTGNVYTEGHSMMPLASITNGIVVRSPAGTETMTLYYVKSPTLMTEDDIISGTTKPEINEKYHRLIVYGAAAKLALHAGSGMEGYHNAWQATFDGELAKLIGGGAGDKGK